MGNIFGRPGQNQPKATPQRYMRLPQPHESTLIRGLLVNRHYWYTDEDINTLLNCLLAPRNVRVMAAQSPFLNGLVGAEEVFSNAIDSMTNPQDNFRAAVMPLNLTRQEINDTSTQGGSHWAALCFDFICREANTLQPNPNGARFFTYFDSFGHPLKHNRRNQAKFQSLVTPQHGISLTLKGRPVRELRDEQQNDSASCGPWTVDNLFCLALGLEPIVPKEDEYQASAMGLRRLQQIVLKRHRQGMPHAQISALYEEERQALISDF